MNLTDLFWTVVFAASPKVAYNVQAFAQVRVGKFQTVLDRLFVFGDPTNRKIHMLYDFI